MNRLTLLASISLLLSLLAAGWWLNRGPQPVALTPTLTGQTEYCLTCHRDLDEISPSHPVETFGCVLCHGGERLALDADLAHSTLRGGSNPSDLSVVEQNCGGANCHSGDPAASRDHIQRVTTSLQATYAGAIAQMRYTFGAQSDLIAHQGIYAVEDPVVTSPTGRPALEAFDPSKETSPALQTFAQNCLTCHLSAQPPEETASNDAAYNRLTGCAACHTPLPAGYDPSLPAEQKTATHRQVHTLTTALSYTQCNACHNRGNYDLGTMQFVERTDTPTDRLHDYYQPIAQFTQCEYTLDCVDCHTRQEVMGDGDLHSTKKENQYIQCRTCHGTLDELPLTKTITDPNDLALRLAFLNPVLDLKVGDTILVTDRGEPLWNVRALLDGTYELFSKSSGQRFTFKPVKGSACTQDPNQQESKYCHACHAVEH